MLCFGFTGACQAARRARLAAPGHDGRVREMGLEPRGDGEPVRRCRRGREGSPVAWRGGPVRAGSAVAAHQQEAPLGHLPRAPDGRAPVPGRPRDARRHRQVAAARRRVKERCVCVSVICIVCAPSRK
jgi:hypothetical protein